MSWTHGGGPRGALLTFQGIPDATMKTALDALWTSDRGNLSAYLGTAVKQDDSVNYGVSACEDDDAPLGIVAGIEGNPTLGYAVTVLALTHGRIVTFKRGDSGATRGHTAVVVDGDDSLAFKSAASAGDYLVLSVDEPSGSFDALIR